MTGDSTRRLTRTLFVQAVLAALLLGVGIAVASQLPVRQSESPSFASPMFQRSWVSDAAASTRVVDLWGSEPLTWRVEPYAGAPNDRRVVQYFDRGRMEIESGSSEVTVGKLVTEMLNGEIDLGSGITRELDVPAVAIDSGDPDPRVPSYGTLSQLIENQEPGASTAGSRVTEWIDSSGPIDGDSTPTIVHRSEYIEETGVHLPDVFTRLFEQPDFQGGRWEDVLGLPISEPFWAEYRRKGDLQPSLIQVFERRILIYSPQLEEANRFSFASSGRHYAMWRYGQDIHNIEAAAGDELADQSLTMADGVEASVFAEGIGTPVDMTLSATGHLMILNAEGQILIARSQDPDGLPDSIDVWADGINEPQGMVTRGDSVLVTADDRIWWYHDQDGRGVLDEVEALHANRTASQNSSYVRGKPVVNSSGDVFTRIEGEVEADGLLLRALASDDPLVSLTEVIDTPGPVSFANGDLLVTGRNSDDVPSVMLLPSVSAEWNGVEPDRVASFSPDASVRAIAVMEEEIWPLSSFGDVIIAIEDTDYARIFAMSRHPVVDETETIELARGLGRPTALEVGLDGSLFIADADTGRIIRLQYGV